MFTKTTLRQEDWIRNPHDDDNNNNNNNNNNLFLIRRKLTSEYDQMRLTTITTCNNYNEVYLRIPNLTITGKSLPK